MVFCFSLGFCASFAGRGALGRDIRDSTKHCSWIRFMSTTDTVAWPILLLSGTIAIVAISVVLFYDPGAGWRVQWPPLLWFTRSPQRETPSHHGTTASSSLFVLERALGSYEAYGRMARAELRDKIASFVALRGRHQHLARSVGYSEKLLKYDSSIALNEKLTSAITRQARADMAKESPPKVINHASGQPDIGRVRETLKHIARDWSGEGREERERTFAPIFEELVKIAPEGRPQTHVLVPGSGLGRLAWEIAQLGKTYLS
jgi:N2227-like protein